jgi:hypothetical protein
MELTILGHLNNGPCLTYLKAKPKEYETYVDNLNKKLLLRREDDDFQVATRGGGGGGFN